MKLLLKHANIQGRTVRADGLRTYDDYFAIHFTDGVVLVGNAFWDYFGRDDALMNAKELRLLEPDTLAALGIDMSKLEE